MAGLTDAELRDMATRAAEATPGPWRALRDGREEFRNVSHYVETADGALLIAQANGANTDREANAAFIAASRQDAPRLLAEVRRLREENARLRVEAAAHTVEFSGVLEDNARLRADLRSAAARIAAQSELLSQRAEKAPGLRQETRGGAGEGCGP